MALFPIGAQPSAYAFFESYIAAPIVLGFYIFWKVVKRTRFVRAQEVDLVSGRRELDIKEILAEEAEERTHWRWHKRYNYLRSPALTV